MNFDEFVKNVFGNQKFIEELEADKDTFMHFTRVLVIHAKYFYDRLIEEGFNEQQALMIVCHHGCMPKVPGK